MNPVFNNPVVEYLIFTSSIACTIDNAPVLALNTCFHVDLFALINAAGNCKSLNIAAPFTDKFNLPCAFIVANTGTLLEPTHALLFEYPTKPFVPTVIPISPVVAVLYATLIPGAVAVAAVP